MWTSVPGTLPFWYPMARPLTNSCSAFTKYGVRSSCDADGRSSALGCSSMATVSRNSLEYARFTPWTLCRGLYCAFSTCSRNLTSPLLRSKGRCCAIISYSSTPAAHMSTLLVYPSAGVAHCSGAMYSGVPQDVIGFRLTDASPKSASFTRPRLVMRTLADFRSRWIMRRLCRCKSATKICTNVILISSSLSSSCLLFLQRLM
mmetsp:Transcript_7229/g.22637  ORF Transcript_7229/g.22637 Transcript_7229/m.22637 type:complete len:203 (-) Transcript_7229:522-1130(-)